MASIQSSGFNHLSRIASSLDPYVEEALDHGVVTVMEVADPLTPVDTGALRANRAANRIPGGREIIWIQHYAAYQEFGTSRGVPAKRFARTGADAGIEVINGLLAGWEGTL